jgi:hypothetical protein
LHLDVAEVIERVRDASEQCRHVTLVGSGWVALREVENRPVRQSTVHAPSLGHPDAGGSTGGLPLGSKAQQCGEVERPQMDDLFAGLIRVLVWLFPWESLLFPVRIERLATRQFKQWRTMGTGIFPARICGLADFDPLDGFLVVTTEKVRFSVDIAGRLHPIAISPSADADERIRWGEVTGRTVWSKGSRMKFVRDDPPSIGGEWSMLQVSPIWTMVVQHGLRSVGFQVEGVWPASPGI